MASSRSISDVINDLGFGRAQIQLILFAGGIHFMGGTVMTLFGTLPSSIAKELSLHPYQRAFLFVSAVVGLLIGNLSSLVSDTYLGRRKPILLGYTCVLLFVVTGTQLYAYWPMVFCWMLAGFGLGFGGTAWNSLSSESSPLDRRMLMNGCAQSLFSIASFIVLVTEFSYSTHLDFGSQWRTLMLWALLPCAVLFILAIFVGFVDSAPLCLAQGDANGATDVLRTIRKQNARPHVSIEFDDTVTSKKEVGILMGVRVVFSRQLRATTLAVCWATFVLNFVGYGTSYGMPIVLSSMKYGLISPALVLCVGPIFDMLGYATGIFSSKVMSRRALMSVYLAGAIICNLLLCLGFSRIQTSPNDIIGQMCVLLVGMTSPFVTAPGWLVVYVYASEVFPTMCRSFGTGVVMCAGRIGSITAPLAFEALHLTSGTHFAFFALLVVFMLVNLFLVIFVLHETKGRPLQQVLDEEIPLLRKGSKEAQSEKKGKVSKEAQSQKTGVGSSHDLETMQGA